MYWRVRKLNPEQIVRQYGVHAALVASVIFNIALLTKTNSAKAVTSSQKLNYERFASQVTSHLYDASYLTFSDSMNALVKELGPSAQQKLMSDGTMPRNLDEMKTIERELLDKKSISAVRISDVSVGTPTASGFLPIDLKAQVIVHDSEGVRPTNMRMKYLVGAAMDKGASETRPVIVDLAAEPLSQ